MFHPFAHTYGYVDEPLDGNHGPPLCLWSHEFYETDKARDFVRGYIFQFGRGTGSIVEAITSTANGRLPWGEDHHKVYRRLLGHRLGMSTITEDLPEEHFVTAFFGVLDTRLHSVNYHAAGQGPLLHFCAASGEVMASARAAPHSSLVNLVIRTGFLR